MRIVLHIGTEKTGSTAIQNSLNDNRDFLESKDILVPTIFGGRNARDIASFYADQRDYGMESDRDWSSSSLQFKQWRERVSQNLDSYLLKRSEGTTVLSSEHFHSRMFSTKSVQALATKIRPVFEEVVIVAYFRPQWSLAFSQYSMRARFDSSVSEAEALRSLKPTNPYFDYPGLLERWETAFHPAKVITRVHSEQLEEYDAVEDFFECLQSVTKADLGAFQRPKNRPNQSQSLLRTGTLSTLRNHLGFDIRHLESALEAIPALDQGSLDYRPFFARQSQFDELNQKLEHMYPDLIGFQRLCRVPPPDLGFSEKDKFSAAEVSQVIKQVLDATLPFLKLSERRDENSRITKSEVDMIVWAAQKLLNIEPSLVGNDNFQSLVEFLAKVRPNGRIVNQLLENAKKYRG